MYVATRRAAMLGGSSLLFGCSFFTPTSTTIGGTPVSMAQAYADDLADALSSGADIYLASQSGAWGTRFRATKAFMLQYVDEAVVLYDRASLNPQGVDARGLSEHELLPLMSGLTT